MVDGLEESWSGDPGTRLIETGRPTTLLVDDIWRIRSNWIQKAQNILNWHNQQKAYA